MKIAYIIPQWPGQTHIFFWREMNALKAMGVEVEVVSTRRPPSSIVCHAWSEQAAAEATYLKPLGAAALSGAIWQLLKAGPVRLGRCIKLALGDRNASWRDRLKTLALLPFAGRLISIAEARGFQHLHAHSCANAAILALFVERLTGTPYSMSLHSPLSMYGPHQRAKWSHAVFAITVTQRLKREVLEALPMLDPNRIDVAPMGVDLNVFRRAEGHAYAPPADGEPWRIVTCGRLHRGKGHQDLIDAIALLRAQGVKVHLTVLGEGDARPMLEERIRKLKLSEHVQLAGAVDETIVRDTLGAAHLFALASHDEAIGVATMEAMAMGLPVVVTDVGGVRELVRDGVDGRLVPAQNPEAMADAIRQIMNECTLSREMGAAGRKRIEQYFSSRRSAEIIAKRIGCSAGDAAKPNVSSAEELAGVA